MDAEDLGHAGSSRARVYIIMVWKNEVVETYDCNKMFKHISNAMRQLVTTNPEDYFVADQTDLRLEQQRVARQRQVEVRTGVTRIHCGNCQMFLIQTNANVVFGETAKYCFWYFCSQGQPKPG